MRIFVLGLNLPSLTFYIQQLILASVLIRIGVGSYT
jgi:hypothetical protein